MRRRVRRRTGRRTGGAAEATVPASPPAVSRAPSAAPAAVLGAALAATAVAAGLALACAPDDADRSTAALVRRHCARCHGLDGRGNRRAVARQPGLDLTRSELAARGDRAEVRRWIEEGEGTMPGFEEKLSAEEIERLVDWSLALAGGGPPPAEAGGG